MKMPSSFEKHQPHESLPSLRMVLLKTVLISSVMAILLGVRLRAQVLYGGVVGNVTDPSGAVVPNAAVRARNLDTGDVLQTTTGNTGSFAIGNVPPGRFDCSVRDSRSTATVAHRGCCTGSSSSPSCRNTPHQSRGPSSTTHGRLQVSLSIRPINPP